MSALKRDQLLAAAGQLVNAVAPVHVPPGLLELIIEMVTSIVTNKNPLRAAKRAAMASASEHGSEAALKKLLK